MLPAMDDLRGLHQGLYDEPGSAAPPQVAVGFGERGLEIRGLDGLLVATWLYADVHTLAPARPGQALVLGCTASPDARLTILVTEGFVEPLHAHAPQTVPESKPRHVRRRPLWSLGWVIVGVAMLVMIGLGWWAVRTIDEALSDLPRTVSRLVRPLIYDVTLPPRCEDMAAEMTIARLARRIGPSGGMTTVPEVVVLNTPLVQSFVGFGGEPVYLTRGLLEHLRGPGEFTGWLAHELGHVAQNQWPGVTSVHAAGIDTFHVSCQSEAAEMEADAWALRALERAEGSADGLLDLLERLPKGMSGDWTEFLCTHPVTPERLRAVRFDKAAGGNPLMTDEEWQGVRSMCATPS